MSNIVLIDADERKALYVDGKLIDYGKHYYFDFDYGFSIASRYPNSNLYILGVDWEWLEKYWETESDFPEYLSDVKTL